MAKKFSIPILAPKYKIEQFSEKEIIPLIILEILLG
jgi:hypothetical protein